MNASRRISIAGLVASLLAVAALPGLAAAQDGGTDSARAARHGSRTHAGRGHGHATPEQRLARMEHRLDAMKSSLGLSSAQEARIRGVFQNGAARARTVLAEQTEPTPARREALHAIRRDMRERMTAVLTPAQWTQLSQMRQERRQARQSHRQSRRQARGQDRRAHRTERAGRAAQ